MKFLWPDRFAMSIPERWEVREDGNVIELVPKPAVGACHVTAYDGAFADIEDGEILAWLDRVANKNDAEYVDTVAVDDDGRSRCAKGLATSSSHETRWLVGVRVWPTTAILFTYNDDGSADANLAEASEIFRSIELKKDTG